MSKIPQELAELRAHAKWGLYGGEVACQSDFGRYAAYAERLTAEIDSERAERVKLDSALRAKDAAMSILFDRLAEAGVDCSDLIS